MYIIQVIPISKGVGSEVLSYFTTQNIEIGSLVEISIRKSLKKGLVVNISPANEMKSQIKNSSFILKKAESIVAEPFLPPNFLRMANDTSNYFASTISTTLDTLLPKYVIDNSKMLSGNIKLKINDGIHEKYVIQGEDEERFLTWRSLIRQEFAKKKSIVFFLPTIEESIQFHNKLSKGIEEYAFLFHSDISKKEINSQFKKYINQAHPVVCILTPAFMSFLRHDIGIMVIESEASRFYKSQKRPYLDYRFCIEKFSEYTKCSLYLADTLLRLETLFRYQSGSLIESTPFKYKSLNFSQNVLVDMTKYKNTKNGFTVLSDEVLTQIKETKNTNGHMLVLTNRRGLSPVTVCGDCQNIVLCQTCHAPVVLHKMTTKNIFLCHKCGHKRSTEELCKICGSWKLSPLGIGIDLVEEAILEYFNDAKIFKISSDNLKNKKEIYDAIETFKKTPGSILLGTEMALNYLEEKVDNTAIISFDSLLTIPDFRIPEKILHLIIKTRNLTLKKYIIQSRKIDEKVFDYSMRGNIQDFINDTLEERKTFKYPPFYILIKITLEGERDKIIGEMKNIQDLMDKYTVEVFPSFTKSRSGNFQIHGLIRVQSSSWPSTDLLQKLLILPPHITIKIDPETLL